MTRPISVALLGAGELYGGVERFIETFASFLLSAGHAPAVVLFHDNLLAGNLRALGVKTHVLGAQKYSPAVIFNIRRFFRDFDPDIVHVHGYKASIFGGFVACQMGIPVVKTEHTALEPFAGFDNIKMRLNMALEKFATSLTAEKIVWVTEHLRAGRGGLVIHNGVDVTAKSRDVAVSPARVAIVGRLAAVKGHITLFEAVAKLDPARRPLVEVYGSGPEEGRLLLAIKNLGIGSSVKFYGFQKDVVEKMSHCQILAMPSLHEGLPYTLLEAMHLGMAIIASDVGGLREVLRHGETALLIPPTDVNSWAGAIDSLTSNPSIRKSIGGNAAQAANRLFSLGTMARSYLDVYREVIKK